MITLSYNAWEIYLFYNETMVFSDRFIEVNSLLTLIFIVSGESLNSHWKHRFSLHESSRDLKPRSGRKKYLVKFRVRRTRQKGQVQPSKIKMDAKKAYLNKMELNIYAHLSTPFVFHLGKTYNQLH